MGTLDKISVIAADEMKRIEQLAFEEGESDLAYMENAGEGIAKLLVEKLISPASSKPISLLIGKGNNGGDAFVVGTILLKKGYQVKAYILCPLDQCSSLSQKMGKRFKKAGGVIEVMSKSPPFEEGIILDGLVGTGFKGRASGLLLEMIEGANASKLPIYAIDIPSGLNGNTGEVGSCAIKAHTTFYLGLPKIGFFIGKGWNLVGNLVGVDFGMPTKFSEKAEEIARLIDLKKAGHALPEMKRDRHKYEAGYVVAIAGSKAMPGAAILACFATLKVGAGIVRLFHPEKMEDVLSSSPYELIKEAWDLKHDERILEEVKRAKAVIIGPGCGRSKEVEKAVTSLLSKLKVPTVIDADALFFLAKNQTLTLPEETVLTPHHGEMERILGEPPTFDSCLKYVKEKKVTLVLKGAPTIIFHRNTQPLIVPHGDPGMATAGTGDVLTGIIAGLIAQGMPLCDGASLGVLLHALSGEIAAQKETSYGMIASDLIYFLHESIFRLKRLQ
jgi:ADP-dependent NAD(P)H-hydrate dehydratase / NAD(P)H-hydrate epimerase